jgi:hypothetical protein
MPLFNLTKWTAYLEVSSSPVGRERMIYLLRSWQFQFPGNLLIAAYLPMRGRKVSAPFSFGT